MHIKLFLTLSFFQIAIFNSLGQNIKDIFDFGNSKETTLLIDSENATGKAMAEQEKAKQDSLKQVNDKWGRYFSEQNIAIQEVLNSIGQIDSTQITKEIIDNYDLQVNSLRKEVESRLLLANKETWEDRLFKMESSFIFNCESASLKLKYMKEKLEVKKKEPNRLIILGVCFAVIMMLIPQIRSRLMMRKVKKQQKKQEKKQAEEEEKHRLLSDEDEIITLK